MEFMNSATPAQKHALGRVYRRYADSVHEWTCYADFLETVQPGFGCLMVPVPRLFWLGVEPDGYTHS